MASVPEYGPSELFRSDWEVYGTWMSDAPFAALDGIGDGLREQARQIALMLPGVPEGTYPLAAVFGKKHTARTRRGDTMWWVTLATEVSLIELSCFSPRREDETDVPLLLGGIRQGQLVSAQVSKYRYQQPGRGTRTGWRLADIWPIGG